MSVLIFAEGTEGKIKKSAKEALCYGVTVAEKLGTDAVAVTLGNVSDDELENLGKYGVGKIININDDRLNNFDSKAYCKAIEKAAQHTGADVIVLAMNFNGKALAPRLSVRLKAGLVAGAVDYPSVDGDFVIRKNVFSGKALADYVITTPVKIISLTPNTVPVVEKGGNAIKEVLEVSFEDSDFGEKVKEVKKVSGKVPLAEAEIVVSGGRGLKGPENWGMIEELADLLGAATACSRPVTDVNWRPHHEHVGQTGLTIRPNLYIAIAISGAIQHLAGVNGSKYIVVINIDPEAPFFKAADYGIVGDAFEVVPKLIEALKKYKEKNQ